MRCSQSAESANVYYTALPRESAAGTFRPFVAAHQYDRSRRLTRPIMGMAEPARTTLEATAVPIKHLCNDEIRPREAHAQVRV
jgi:hypothetical protein